MSPASQPSQLSHHVVVADGHRPERAMLVLHGILGRGNNWRSFARRLVEARPEWALVLVDLRAHGDSREVPPPDDLDAAAEDLERLLPALPAPVHAVLGHSFGGKVALRFAERTRAPLDELFVVDSLPGAQPAGPNDVHQDGEGTERVLEMLDALPPRFESRAAFLAHVTGAGHSETLARWLAQNLDRDEAGAYRFGLDVARVRALLDDYRTRDLWPTLDPPRSDQRAHLIVGGRSTVYSEAARAQAQALAEKHPGRVSVHVLEAADHWVHVDDPDGLHALVTAALR